MHRSLMNLPAIIKFRHPLRNLKATLSRKRARRLLNRDLASFTNKELTHLLARAGVRRGDLFTRVKGNRRNRQLMGQMLARFDIDREIASEHHWRKLVHAEQACARCSNVAKCQRWLAWGRKNDAPNVFCRNAGLFTQMRLDLGRLMRTETRTYSSGHESVSSEAASIADAWSSLGRSQDQPDWRWGPAAGS